MRRGGEDEAVLNGEFNLLGTIFLSGDCVLKISFRYVQNEWLARTIVIAMINFLPHTENGKQASAHCTAEYWYGGPLVTMTSQIAQYALKRTRSATTSKKLQLLCNNL